jgi:hypothetical protein
MAPFRAGILKLGERIASGPDRIRADQKEETIALLDGRPDLPMEVTSRRETFSVEKSLITRTGEGEVNLLSKTTVLRSIGDEDPHDWIIDEENRSNGRRPSIECPSSLPPGCRRSAGSGRKSGRCSRDFRGVCTRRGRGERRKPAPKGRQHKAWGVSPRLAPPTHQKAQEGRQQTAGNHTATTFLFPAGSSPTYCCRPFGARDDGSGVSVNLPRNA